MRIQQQNNIVMKLIDRSHSACKATAQSLSKRNTLTSSGHSNEQGFWNPREELSESFPKEVFFCGIYI